MYFRKLHIWSLQLLHQYIAKLFMAIFRYILKNWNNFGQAVFRLLDFLSIIYLIFSRRILKIVLNLADGELEGLWDEIKVMVKDGFGKNDKDQTTEETWLIEQTVEIAKKKTKTKP